MKEFYKHSQVWLAGSHMYRVNIATSDRDYIGVEFSPRKIIDPFTDKYQTDVQEENVRHSAYKFAQLLVKGNPTIIDLVYHEPIKEQGFISGLVSAVKPHAITSQLIRGYMGYLKEQKRRGFKQQRKHGHRPEEELLGYDPKYLGHCFRLATVLQNIYTTGGYHYLTESEASHILLLRGGTIPEKVALEHVEDYVNGILRGINPETFPDTDTLKEVIRGYFRSSLLRSR